MTGNFFSSNFQIIERKHFYILYCIFPLFVVGPLNIPESVVIFNFELERPELVCGNFGSKLELPPAARRSLSAAAVSQCLRVNTLIKPGK